MQLIKLCAIFCILISQFFKQVYCVDETLVEFTKGSDVADSVVRKIHRAGIFLDDQSLFRRIGFVETRFGEDQKTYREDYFGGIWQVDEEHFVRTKNVTNPSDIYQQISTRFNINWSKVQWRDLLKPFYSGLAARLYLASLDRDFPGTSAEQAEFWLANYRYNSDIATTEQYVRLVKILESDPVCEGMVDICIVLDGSGSITPPKFQLARSFVAEFVRTFSLATSRSAFVLYSDEAEKIFDFDNTLSESEMNETIFNIRYPSLGTNTPAGVLMAVDFFKRTITRIGIPRIVATFTDGLYNKGNLPEAIAAVREAELVSFAVGIGDEFDPLELMQIALNVPKRVFTLSNYDALAEFFYQMNSAVCEVPQTPPIGESQSGSLNAGETRYFKYEVPESGLTINMDSGAVLYGYYSYSEETPNSAVNDGTFDKVGVIPYQETQQNGNVKEEPVTVVYISIRSNSEKTAEYVIQAVEGNQETSTTEGIASTTDSSMFDCNGKPGGMYPHPFECSHFIGCRNNESTEYTCQSPLLFNPLNSRCDLPELVDCDISCTNRPDGAYPYPHNCRLFIICHNSIMDVYECPDPLLFDPVTEICNFPDLVDCSD